jgi:hypothetical protein
VAPEDKDPFDVKRVRVAEVGERTLKGAEHLGLAPRQLAVPSENGFAELLQRGGVIARERREVRRDAELRRAEVQKVIRIVVPADRPPHVGIDHAGHEGVPVFDEERLDLGRKHRSAA